MERSLRRNVAKIREVYKIYHSKEESQLEGIARHTIVRHADSLLIGIFTKVTK